MTATVRVWVSLWLFALCPPSLAASDARGVSLAMPGVEGVQLPPEMARFYAEHLAQAFNAAGVRVTTQREIATLLGMERQRSLMGCSDGASSCIAELAAALGVDGVLLADMARFGSAVQVNLKVLGSADGRILSSRSARVQEGEPALDFLTRAAGEMAQELAQKLRRTLSPSTSGSPLVADAGVSTSGRASLRQRAWIPAAVGGGLLVAGGIFGALTASRHAQLTSTSGAPLTHDEAERTAREMGLFQTLTWVGIGTGAASLAVSLAFYALGAPANTPTVAVAPGSHGGMTFSLQGDF